MEIKPIFFRSKQSAIASSGNALPGEVVELPVDASLEEKIIAAICTVYDPEIPVNIYDLGLIYKININHDNEVVVKMTLTAPACPVAEVLPVQLAEVIRQVEGVSDARVDLVWEPAWSKDSMSDEAKLALGLF